MKFAIVLKSSNYVVNNFKAATEKSAKVVYGNFYLKRLVG